jgi:hypothetical protein
MKESKQNKVVSDLPQGIKNPLECHFPFFKRFMTLPEAGFYTGQAESTIKRAVYDGLIPVIQRGDRSKWILDVLDLDSWLLKFKKFHNPVDQRIRTRDGKFK